MASVEKRYNKAGNLISFRIHVFHGRDEFGKAHENGQDDDADGNDCARAEQGGEDRRSDDGEQNADNDRLIAAQLDGLANQSVRNTGFQQNRDRTKRRTRH